MMSFGFNIEESKEGFCTFLATQNYGYGSLGEALETNGYISMDELIVFGDLQNEEGVDYEDGSNYKESVNKNKGFYIGRYELGASTARTSGSDTTTVTDIIKANGTPVSKEGYYPYNYISFDQALGLVESMYNSTEFTPSLLTGSAWDRTFGWIYETSENKEEVLNQLKWDSTNWGNYKNAEFNITKGKYSEDDGSSYKEVTGTYTKTADSAILLTTGATIRNSKNNIFDLAGNASEWVNAVKRYTSWTLCSYCSNEYGSNGNSQHLAGLNSFTLSSVVHYSRGARAALYLQ